MSKFSEIVNNDTPRLVVMFRRPAPDQEQFQWGMIGKMPVITAVGYITRVQAELRLSDSDHNCDEMALVIAWHCPTIRNCIDGTETKLPPQFDYFVHPNIPVDSLVGMLETIKAALVGSSMAQQARNQQVGLLDGTGNPIKRRP